jgi:hypothetical protein
MGLTNKCYGLRSCVRCSPMRFARNFKAICNGSQGARFVARSLSDDGWSVWDRRDRRFLNRREIAKLTPDDLDGIGEGFRDWRGAVGPSRAQP